MSLIIRILKLLPPLPGANELTRLQMLPFQTQCCIYPSMLRFYAAHRSPLLLPHHYCHVGSIWERRTLKRNHLLKLQQSGLWFNIKMLSYQYRKSHCGDKMVVRSSNLHNEISYIGKMASLYWISPLAVMSFSVFLHICTAVYKLIRGEKESSSYIHINGLAQDCRNSSALAMELL